MVRNVLKARSSLFQHQPVFFLVQSEGMSRRSLHFEAMQQASRIATSYGTSHSTLFTHERD
jgi:hypothetical protein